MIGFQNVKSDEEFDIAYRDGRLRFTKTKVMLKWKWSPVFKTVMDIKGKRWGCTFKKKDCKNGIYPFFYDVILNLNKIGVELIIFDIEDTPGTWVVTTSRLLKNHPSKGKDLKHIIYYNPNENQRKTLVN